MFPLASFLSVTIYMMLNQKRQTRPAEQWYPFCGITAARKRDASRWRLEWMEEKARKASENGHRIIVCSSLHHRPRQMGYVRPAARNFLTYEQSLDLLSMNVMWVWMTHRRESRESIILECKTELHENVWSEVLWWHMVCLFPASGKVAPKNESHKLPH